MTSQVLRFAYICEFLLAVMAIFTAWSEIGGQAALDLMHWGWKFGFSFALAASIVGYTTVVVKTEKIATWPAIGWLVLILLITICMGVVTYYYTLEEEAGESDEPSGTVTLYDPSTPVQGAYS